MQSMTSTLAVAMRSPNDMALGLPPSNGRPFFVVARCEKNQTGEQRTDA